MAESRSCWIDETPSHWPVLLPCLRSCPQFTPQHRRAPAIVVESSIRLLGDLPDRKRPIGGKKRSEEERDGYILETWDLDLNGIETVPAYFARPSDAHRRVPRCSSTTRTAAATRSARRSSSRAAATCSRALREGADRPRLRRARIDNWVFGERSHTTELDMFKAHAVEGPGAVGDDGLRQPARGGLARRAAGCRSGRIATLGMSMGSTMAWWLAALDERVKVTRRHLLPHRFPRADREEGPVAARRLLLRARTCSSTSRPRRSTRSSRRARTSASRACGTS